MKRVAAIALVGAFALGSAVTTLLWQGMISDAQSVAERAIANAHDALDAAASWRFRADIYCRAFEISSGLQTDCPNKRRRPDQQMRPL